MRLIRTIAILLALILSAGVVFAQEDSPIKPRTVIYVSGGEFDTNTSFVTFWKRHDLSAKDKRLCGGIGYNGSNCAFQFAGSNLEKSRLVQTKLIDSTGDSTESHFGFVTAHVKPTAGENTLTFIVTFTFKNNAPAVKATYTYTVLGASEEYEMIYFETSSFFSPRKVKSTKITIRNGSPKGSTILVDNLFIGVSPVTVR